MIQLLNSTCTELLINC